MENGHIIGAKNGITVAGGNTIINGGIVEGNRGIYITSGNVTVGNSNEPVNQSNPTIIGGTGIYVAHDMPGDIYFNNGIIKHNGSYIYTSGSDGTVTIRDGYKVVEGTDGEYQTAYLEALPIMMSGPDFQDTIYSVRNTVTSVEFLNTIPDLSTYTEGTNKWDVSEFQNGSVMAWLDGTDMKIGANGDVVGNPDSSKLFYYFTSVTTINFNDNFDTSNITDMNSMFYMNSSSSSNKLTSIEGISNWDTSNVTDMSDMFYRCYDLTSLDIGNWDTSNVIDMGSIFYDCNTITSLDIGSWNTSNVTNMSSMFNSCGALTSLDIGSWDTSKVTDMSYMFRFSRNLTNIDIGGWDTSKVTDMRNMFGGLWFLMSLGDISDWDTSNVTNMSSMFDSCSDLTNKCRGLKPMGHKQSN